MAGASFRRVADETRALIMRGALSPGERLRELHLADQFRVGRGPVRGALKVLTAEGIVTHSPHHGFSVTKVSPDEARQLYKLRRWLEAELLASAEWPTEEQIEAIQREFDLADEALKRRDRVAWGTHLREASCAILELSPQKVLVREAMNLWNLTDRYRSVLPLPEYSAPENGQREHAVMIALRRRDRTQLLESYHRDRARIEASLLAIFEAQYD